MVVVVVVVVLPWLLGGTGTDGREVGVLVSTVDSDYDSDVFPKRGIIWAVGGAGEPLSSKVWPRMLKFRDLICKSLRIAPPPNLQCLSPIFFPWQKVELPRLSRRVRR